MPKTRSIRYLEPGQVHASLPEGASHPRVEIEGDRTVLSARIKRAFPLSEPGKLLSIQDGEGTEVGLLRTIDGVDAQTRKLIEDQLDRRYFTPQIEAIERLVNEAGMWRFVVRTQRGPADFFVRNWRDSAIEIAPNRWHINSVDGARFEILNLEALDAQSRRLMDQLL